MTEDLIQRRITRRTRRTPWVAATLLAVALLAGATTGAGAAASAPAAPILTDPATPPPEDSDAPRRVESTSNRPDVAEKEIEVPDGGFSPQIVGGGNATNVPTAAIALITFDGGASCTGTLVAPQWVLTAAHCLVQFSGQNPTRVLNNLMVGSDPNYKVFLGTPPHASPDPAAAFTVEQIVLSDGYLLRQSADDVPGYQSGSSWVSGVHNLPNDPGLDDFGLLKLSVPATGITPIPLAVDDSLSQAGQVVWAAGWGLTGSGTGVPAALQEAQMVVQSTIFCEIAWRSFYSAASNTCYGATNAATCSGDSGGPVMNRDERGQWWVVAVITGGPVGCPLNQPYVGVRSSWVAPFVTQVTGVPQLGRPGESLNPIVPVRIVDSRIAPNGLGVEYMPPTVDDPKVLGLYRPVPSLPAGFTVRRPLFNPEPSRVSGLPSAGGLAGVVLNVTVDAPVGVGFLTVYPCADGRPPTSNLNYAAGQTVANLVVTKVDRNGDLCFLTSNQVSLIVDVIAWLGPASPVNDRALVSAPPVRLLDTRAGTPLTGGGTHRTLTVTGAGRAPVGASAVVLNVTATRSAGLGFVTVWPCGTRPHASNLNPIPGRDIPAAVISAVDGNGNVCLYSSTTTDLVVDLNGWAVSATTGTTKTVTPFRLADTRSGTKVAAGAVRQFTVAGAGAGTIPAAGALDAALLNVTVTEPSAAGHATVYPCTGTVPEASNLNFAAGQTVPNAVVAKLDASGRVCVRASQAVHLVVDVTGYVRK